MNDKEFKAQQKRIQKLMAKWRLSLALGSWTVRCDYSQGPIKSNGEWDKAIASCRVDWQYLRATITWDLGRVEDMDDEDLEWCFFHEAMHVLVREMREEGIAHEERVCTVLANMAGWMYKAGLADGKKEAKRA